MSGNPTPQHTPTDGLGVAAKIGLAGGTGASAISTIVAYQEYAITLSVSASGTYETAAALTASLVDIKNNAYVPSGSNPFTCRSNANPSDAGSPPAWYLPSPGSNGVSTYNADVAQAVASGGGVNATITVTGLHVGTCDVFVQFPTYDNTVVGQGNPYNGVENPNDMIYVRLLVTVIP